MKKAIVFAGGGSKGAYQIGAWKALNELGEDFAVATGTSIGSINAGFYVQHDFDAAYEMWKNLTAGDIMVNGINLDKSFESIFAQRENLIPFVKNYFKAKNGADVTPFHNMLRKLFDSEKFFGSDIDYALMTVKFPSLDPVEITKEEMKKYSEPWRWIAASAACFPVFPVEEIDGTEYADGGYYDNIPVASAFRLGAEQVTVIDLKTESNHEGYIRHPRVKYIKPSEDLGTFMNFGKDAIDFSIYLGYSDTMKAYGKYRGYRYTFTPGEDAFADCEEYSAVFMKLLTETEANFDFSASVGKLKLQRVNRLEGCTFLLSKECRCEHPSEEELFIAALERLMGLLGFARHENYCLPELLYTLKCRVDGLYPLLEYDNETAFATLMRFAEDSAEAKKAEIKRLEDEREKIIACAVIRTLQRINC